MSNIEEDIEDNDVLPEAEAPKAPPRPKLPKPPKKDIPLEEKLDECLTDIEITIQRIVPKLLEKHKEPGPTKGVPSTSILKRFSGLGPKVSDMEEEKVLKGFTTKRYEVSLEDGKKMKLKVLETEAEREDNVCLMFCEFYLGRSLNLITNSVVKPLDIKAYKDGKIVRAELLIECEGVPLSKHWEKLKKGEGMWIGYQIVDSVTALGDVLMGHIGLSPETIEISKEDSKVKLNPTMLVPLYQSHKINNEILAWSLVRMKFIKDKYLAPELTKTLDKTKEILVEKAEVYTCCLLLCELLQKELGLTTDTDLYQSSLDFIRGPMQEITDNPEFTSFMELCLDKDPIKRPAIHQLRQILYKEVVKQRPELKKRSSMLILFDYKIMGKTFESLGKYFVAMKYYRCIIGTIKRRAFQSHRHGNKELGGLYVKLASINQTLGRMKKALRYNKSAIDIYKRMYGEYNEQTAYTYYNIGTAHNYFGRYGKALKKFQKALHIFLKVYGENNENVFKCLTVLGYIYFCLDKIDVGNECYTKAIEVANRVYSEDDLKKKICVNYCKGMSALYKNDYKMSIECFENLEKITKEKYGADSNDLPIIYNNLGLTYQYRGAATENIKDIEQSLEYFKKAENIYAKKPGRFYLLTCGLFHNIGLSYIYMNSPEEYGSYFKKAIKEGESTAEGKIGCLEKSYYQLWNLQFTSNKIQESETTLVRLMKLTKKLHTKTQRHMICLYKAAEDLYHKAKKKDYEDMFGRKYNKNLNLVVDSEVNAELIINLYISRLYRDIGKPGAALEAARNAERLLACDHSKKEKDFTPVNILLGELKLEEKLYDDAMTNFMRAKDNIEDATFEEKLGSQINRGLAKTCYEQEDYVQALQYSLKAYKLATRSSELPISKTAEITYELGLEYEKLYDYERSVKYYEEAEQVVSSSCSRPIVYFAELCADMINSYSCARYHNKAIKVGENALKYWKELHGNVNDDFVAKVYDRMGNAYRRMNRPAKAIYYLRQALNYKMKNFAKGSVSTALTLSHLGKVYLMIKDFDQAISISEAANKVFKETKKRELLSTYLTLAYAHREKGDIEAALKCCQMSIDYAMTDLVKDKNEQAIVYCKVAEPYKLIKDTNTILKSCCNLAEKYRSEQKDNLHNDLLHLYAITAEVYEQGSNDRNDFDDKALLNYLKADDIVKPKNIYRDEIINFVVCRIYLGMARLYVKKKKYEDAIKRLSMTEKFLRDRFGNGSPLMFNVYYQLIKIYEADNDKDKAEEFKDKLLKLIRSPPGKDQLNLASEYSKLTSEDGEYLEAAVKGENREDLWDCPDMGDVYIKYAKTCKNPAESVSMLTNALEVFKNTYGEVHSRLVETYKLLAETIKPSDSKRAEEYMAAANDIKSKLK